MDGRTPKKSKFLSLFIFLTVFGSTSTQAAVVELSGMLSYGRAQFATGYNSIQRRYTADIAFKFTSVSSIEFEYTDSDTRVSYPTTVGNLIAQSTTANIRYHDRVYSGNWVQNLVSSKWLIQPYFKIGGGRMVRQYTEALPEFGYSSTTTENTVTGVAGLGIRIFLTKNMALKGEFSTYVPKFHFKSWKENELFSSGLSWLF